MISSRYWNRVLIDPLIQKNSLYEEFYEPRTLEKFKRFGGAGGGADWGPKVVVAPVLVVQVIASQDLGHRG